MTEKNIDLSIATDYEIGKGSAHPYLVKVAAHRFTHIHWCHEWNTDYLYTSDDIDEIEKALDEYFKQWGSTAWHQTAKS